MIINISLKLNQLMDNSYMHNPTIDKLYAIHLQFPYKFPS